jgi:hypothetical protein
MIPVPCLLDAVRQGIPYGLQPKGVSGIDFPETLFCYSNFYQKNYFHAFRIGIDAA